MQSAGNRVRISNDISRMRSGGGTMIFPALEMAYHELQVVRADTRHVILLTDGQAPRKAFASSCKRWLASKSR